MKTRKNNICNAKHIGERIFSIECFVYFLNRPKFNLMIFTRFACVHDILIANYPLQY